MGVFDTLQNALFGKAPKPPRAQDPNVMLGTESRFNRPNITSPFGSQTWGTDPTGRATLTTALDPGQQKIFDARSGIASRMLDQGNTMLGTQAPGYSTTARPGAAPYMQPFDINKAGSEAGKAFFENQMALLNPEFAKGDVAFQQELINKGIPMGSEAFNEQMRQHENNKNFAVTGAGREATQIGADLALKERGANESAYDQFLREQGQTFGQDYAKRNQYYDTIAQLVNQPIQGPPDVMGGPLDVGGAYGADEAARRDAYNASIGGRNSMQSGLFNLGSAYLMGRGG